MFDMSLKIWCFCYISFHTIAAIRIADLKPDRLQSPLGFASLEDIHECLNKKLETAFERHHLCNDEHDGNYSDAMLELGNLMQWDNPMQRKRLAGKQIHIAGDSMARDLASTMRCTLPADVKVNFVPFFMVHHDKKKVSLQLKTAAEGADVLVFFLGAWYNFRNENKRAVKAANSNYTTNLMHQPKQWMGKYLTHNPMDLGFGAQIQDIFDPSNMKMGFDPYPDFRRQSGTDGRIEYHSDLLRLAEQLNLLYQDNSTRPKMIYFASPAQHFPQKDSGMYVDTKYANCSPVRNLKEAYGRASDAYEILSQKLGSHIDYSFATKSFEQVAKEGHKFHATQKDCTHYCMNGMVQRAWMKEILENM